MTAPVSPSRRILVVVANPATSSTTGWPVGFWASELTHAWLRFKEAGYDITIASPDGGAVRVDALSDPRDPSGYSKDDIVSLGFLTSPDCVTLLEDTMVLSAVRADDFDAVYVAGGQSPMFTFRGKGPLNDLLMAFWNRGKFLCVVCHGTAALLDLRLPDGSALIEGRRMTGFANHEEDFVDQVSGLKVMPFRIEDEARALGALFVAGHPFEPHAIRDGRLITGQQQHSGGLAANLLIQALGV